MKYILRSYDMFGSSKDQYFEHSADLIRFIQVDRAMETPSIRSNFKVYQCIDVTLRTHEILDREND